MARAWVEGGHVPTREERLKGDSWIGTTFHAGRRDEAGRDQRSSQRVAIGPPFPRIGSLSGSAMPAMRALVA